MNEKERLKEEIKKYTINSEKARKDLKEIDELEAELINKQQRYARLLGKGICPECAGELEMKEEMPIMNINDKDKPLPEHFAKCKNCEFKFKIKIENERKN